MGRGAVALIETTLIAGWFFKILRGIILVECFRVQADSDGSDTGKHP